MFGFLKVTVTCCPSLLTCHALADGAEVTGAVLISAFSHTVNYGNVHLKNDVFQENVMNISDIGSAGFGTFIGGRKPCST